MHRRNTAAYEVRAIDGVELLMLPELSRHLVSLRIDLRSFLFFRNMKAIVELDNGMVIGKSPYGIQQAQVDG